MANFNTDTLSIFHTFSKTQVNGDTKKPQYSSLGNTVNKSGHTVQSNEVWTEEIPFFGKAGDEAAMHTSFSAASRTNDLVKVGNKIYIRNATPYTEGAAYNTLWTEKTTSVSSLTKGENGQYPTVAGALVNGTYLLNAAGVPVVKYHDRIKLTPLVAGNNAFIDSESQASRLQIDGKWVEQFIGVTDSYVNGSASVCYAPAIYKTLGASAPLSAGPGSDYLDYCATGTILWDAAKCAGTEVITCFEYVGKKLATSISSIQTEIDAINGQLGGGVGENSIGSRLTEVEEDIKTLTGTGTGSVTQIVNTAIEGLDSSVVGSVTNGGLYVLIQNGKLTNGYIEKSSVNDKGEVSNGHYFVTADDAVKIATKAANDLEIPEVADATTTSKGIVQLATTEIAGTETSDALVPTVGAVAKSVKSLKSQIETIAGAGLNYHVLGASEELPAPSETYKGIVYLKKNTNSEAGEYIEYLCVSDGSTWSWEQIGSTKTDLTDYAKKTDLAGYAKSVKIDNNTSVDANSSTGVIDLSSYTWISGFYNAISSGGDYTVPNEDSVKLSRANDSNYWGIGVIDATSTDKGLVTLSSTVDASNTGAVTGAGVASAISTAIGEIDLGVTGITVNGGAKQTGDVALNVVTGFVNSSGSSIDGGNLDGAAIRVQNYGDGSYYLYAVVADATNAGVTRLYDKTAATLGSSTAAAVSEKTVKSVYDSLNSAINSKDVGVTSVNNNSGAITITAGGNRSHLTNDGHATYKSNLWGLHVDINGTQQNIVDGFIGGSHYNVTGSAYALSAELPTNATKVIGNFVYKDDGYGGTAEIDTIRAERMISGLYASTATGLTEWVADMPNLKDGNNNDNFMFYGCAKLTTFIGDLSSLENGHGMFYGCNALTTFIGDLSSLTNGVNMFRDSVSTGAKLNSESVECILDSIPDWTGDDEEHELGIGVSTVITAESDVRQSVKDITGVELTAPVKQSQTITYKGWTITFTVTE